MNTVSPLHTDTFLPFYIQPILSNMCVSLSHRHNPTIPSRHSRSRSSCPQITLSFFAHRAPFSLSRSECLWRTDFSFTLFSSGEGGGGLCTVVVPPVNSHGCQWNIKLICGLCDSPEGGGLAVFLQFCPSISILILNQYGLKTYPLNWCFILNSECSSRSVSRHCETDVFSAVTNCCVCIYL